MKQGQVIIDIGPQMNSVSLLENGILNEYYVEYGSSELITGNIYKGKVMNVLDGLQTAFVDIGLAKKGFLYVGETLDGRSDLRKSGLIPQNLNIKAGDYVMVQVTKEETGSKGARLSMNISIPGRYMVYMPNFNFVGVSNKIEDLQTREKLSNMIEKFKEPHEGFIARTICNSSEKKNIISEAKELKTKYSLIKKEYDEMGDKIGVVYTEGNLLKRTVRDMLRENVGSIICNDYDIVMELRKELEKRKSRFASVIMHYSGSKDIIDAFNITNEVDTLLNKKVELPSGGSLIIEKTEALTVVDVNTARFKGVIDREETVFLTNCEAAKEIARQIRLRNIGGIVVVDFIDMEQEEHKEKIVEIMRNAVVFDRIKTRVLDMTGLGLVEIARKKVGNELSHSLSDVCPVCNGITNSQSPIWICRKIKAKLHALFYDNTFESALISLNPNTLDQIFALKFFTNECETNWAGKRIYLIPNENISKNNFYVTGSNSISLTLPKESKLLY